MKMKLLLPLAVVSIAGMWTFLGCAKNDFTPLSDKQIRNLVTEHVDAASGRRWLLEAQFSQVDPTPDRKDEFKRLGKIPFRITAQLTETKEARGETLSRREGGTIHLYVLDEDGKAVVNDSISADKMCPS